MFLSGLRHVGDDQKTHKNPSLRADFTQVRTGPKPFQSSSSSPRPAASATAARTKPAVLELQGKKWIVVSFLADSRRRASSIMALMSAFGFLFNPPGRLFFMPSAGASEWGEGPDDQ